MITWSKAKAKKKALAAVAMALSLLDPTTAFTAPANPLVTSKGKGMVVSSQALADRIGQDVLDRGGNAVDAAVAVGYALAVCHPNAGNIGGGGFAVIHRRMERTLPLISGKQPLERLQRICTLMKKAM